MTTTTAVDHGKLHNGSGLDTEKEFVGDADGYKNEKIDRRSDDIVAEGLPADPDAGLTEAERAAIDKKLLRKLDWKLIPWV
jgi:hypothetical protein